MLETSNYFIGKPRFAGDPSPYAAISVFYSIQSAVSFVLKKDNLKDIKVAIKGVGKVGSELANLLHKAGANLYVSDVDESSLKKIKTKIPKINIVDNETISSLDVDVYSPCAMGNEFSVNNIDKIKAKIICGSANNQLADSKAGDMIFEKGITYVPDYIANAGGLIDVVDELQDGGYNKDRVMKNINNIKDTVTEILSLSKKENQPSYKVADKIAERRFLNK